MRGSFGGIYGIARTVSGGGSGGGGGILKTVVEREVRKSGFNGLQESVAKKTSSTQKATSSSKIISSSSWSSSNNSNSNSNSNGNGGLPLISSSAGWLPTDFGEWEYVEEDHKDDDIFGALPSPHEVQHAIFSLQSVIHPFSPSRLTNLDQMHFDIDKDASNVMEVASSTSSESDWIEPTMLIYNQRIPASSRFTRVYDALNLLQTEPTVQRMVTSLSSDKAVWDAILNNEAVREIRESYHNAQPNPAISDEKSDSHDANPNVLKWMFSNTKSKLLEVIDAISHFLGELFKSEKAEQSDTFSENLKSTFLLTVVVLLIVVIARVHNT